MRSSTVTISLFLSLGILFSACQSQTTGLPLPGTVQNTPAPSPTPADSGGASASEEGIREINPLPPDPLEISFFSKDGFPLQGKFYPGAEVDLPVVVLMHWYPGDQGDWEEIAYWLQNRGMTGIRRGVPWLDPSWFPALPPETSYNVLTFTFRDCEGGCSQLAAEDWLEDAAASLKAARSLQGVNPDQVIAIGASIGADAAVSSCAAALNEDPQDCLGALSLSPGNYLGESYAEQVNRLESSRPPRPAWCMYDQEEPEAAVCETASGKLYQKQSWQGGNLHGMHLLTSTLDPLPLQRIVDFLNQVTEP